MHKKTSVKPTLLFRPRPKFEYFHPIVTEIFARHYLYFYIVEKGKIYLHWKKLSSNQLFSNFFSKTVTFTKFLPKMRESEFPEFPQCAVCVETAAIYTVSHIFGKTFVNLTVLVVLLKKLLNSWFNEIFFSEREFLVFHTVV